MILALLSRSIIVVSTTQGSTTHGRCLSHQPRQQASLQCIACCETQGNRESNSIRFNNSSESFYLVSQESTV